jgi:peptide/nickel transport system ATP-binding protein
MSRPEAPPLLEIRDLAVDFMAAEGVVQAVRGVSFDVPPNRTVALVGESGSGKTVISQAVLGILPAVASVTGGRMLFRDPQTGGEPLDLAAYDDDHPLRRRLRGDRISIIFQEPMSSLSPLHTIGDQINEALMLHTEIDRGEAEQRTVEMLDRVGFSKPRQAFRTYPFELSGGLRQRAMIAMALVCRPALLIADEPTTALDVTIQAQILQLMKDLQAELDMAILFITHDLGVVANMADEVVVLYRGRVMERGSCEALLTAPEHPYLKALMHAVPRLGMAPDERLTPLREVPSADRSLLNGAGRPLARRQEGPILEVAHLKKTFQSRKSGWLGRQSEAILAVDDVSFALARGETFGLVGESGCGKTTVSKLIMRALRPDQGSITFYPAADDPARGAEPIDVLALGDDALERFRRRLQYMFQDPFHSLNPRMTVYDIIAEPLVIHGIGDETARSATCAPLSSPVTYSTFICRDRLSAACSSKVLLPMPGSPPISSTPPPTMPPPSARSSSSWPVGVRGTSATTISLKVATGCAWPMPWKRLCAPAPSARLSSSVFQASHCGHLPSHFGLLPPHSRQMNRVFAMRPIVGCLAGGAVSRRADRRARAPPSAVHAAPCAEAAASPSRVSAASRGARAARWRPYRPAPADGTARRRGCAPGCDGSAP